MTQSSKIMISHWALVHARMIIVLCCLISCLFYLFKSFFFFEVLLFVQFALVSVHFSRVVNIHLVVIV